MKKINPYLRMHMHIFKSRLKSYIEKQSIKLLERNVGEYLYLYDT